LTDLFYVHVHVRLAYTITHITISTLYDVYAYWNGGEQRPAMHTTGSLPHDATHWGPALTAQGCYCVGTG